MIARATDKRSTIAYDADVLVVGGGAAGVAAAVSAARAGMKVLLFEKYVFCGGAAVAGLSGTICGLYAATDDNTKPLEQLVFGFAQQFIELMRQNGGVTDPVCDGAVI